MENYDLLVLGGGTGNIVASAAAQEGMDVALVERDRLGGTCLNRGCNPSKQLIQRANIAETVRNADQFGIDASLNDIAFEDIVDDVATEMAQLAESKAERARKNDHITFYQAEGHFVDEHTVEVNTDNGTEGEQISAERIVLAGGSRPVIPESIDGTNQVDFLTNAEVLKGEVNQLPDRLVAIGGGYITTEMSHFFSQLGTEVAIVSHSDTLVAREDTDVSQQLTDIYRETHDLHLGYAATEISEKNGEKVVTAESENGEEIQIAGDELLIATGRQPNSDLWNVSAAGVGTDDKGFVQTDKYLQTSIEGVWATGDIAGNYMFKHSGDKEAEYIVENAVRGNEREIDYPGMAHAIFSSPQVASLGQSEAEIDGDIKYETGTFAYSDHVLGNAFDTKGGFAKAIIGDDDEILGVHIIGPEASTLIHEVSTAVAAGADATTIAETIHIHPALSEVVQGAFRQVRDTAPSGV